MKLFCMTNGNVAPAEELLLLKPFGKIWKRDRSASKEKALKELAYIYFMYDPKSEFKVHNDMDERSKLVCQAVGLKTGWKPDKDVESAIELFNSFKSQSALILEDITHSINNLRTFLRTVDLSKLDQKGKPVHNPSAIASTIKQAITLARQVKEAEMALVAEEEEEAEMSGGLGKSVLEDGIDLDE